MWVVSRSLRAFKARCKGGMGRAPEKSSGGPKVKSSEIWTDVPRATRCHNLKDKLRLDLIGIVGGISFGPSLISNLAQSSSESDRDSCDALSSDSSENSSSYLVGACWLATVTIESVKEAMKYYVLIVTDRKSINCREEHYSIWDLVHSSESYELT